MLHKKNDNLERIHRAVAPVLNESLAKKDQEQDSISTSSNSIRNTKHTQ